MAVWDSLGEADKVAEVPATSLVYSSDDCAEEYEPNCGHRVTSQAKEGETEGTMQLQPALKSSIPSSAGVHQRGIATSGDSQGKVEFEVEKVEALLPADLYQ